MPSGCRGTAGQSLSPSSAWAVLALGSGDAGFHAHVASRLSDPDRPRAKSRLSGTSLAELLPRLRTRATLRRFAVAAKHLSEMLEDARLVLGGPSAARALGWRQLVTAPDCASLVQAFLNVPAPEALLQAALEALAIVAYEEPVSRADISQIRGTDSAGVIDTLPARGLIVGDARFGGRGRPAFLVTTDAFLQRFGVSSLAELPPRPHQRRCLLLRG